MSSEAAEARLELLRSGVDAFNRGETAPVLAILAEDVECHVAGDLMNTGTYHGHDGYVEMVGTWGEAWQSIAAELVGAEEIDDEHLIVEIHQRAVGVNSGVPVEMGIFWMFEFRDGVVLRFHMYGTREAAMAAARQ